MESKLAELKKRLATVSDLHHASALLGWDQQTYMPTKGANARADQLATLDKLAHELFTTDEIGQLLQDLAGYAKQLPPESDDARLISVAQRDYDKARHIPPTLVEEISRTSALALEAWTQARKESNYKLFQPHLEKIVALEIQEANYLGFTEQIYDALLDQYEPEVTTSQVQAIFDGVKKELVPFARAVIANSDRVDDAVLYREYDEQRQWDFGVSVIKELGFDFEEGRQDKSVHPFTSSFGLGDTRITTRIDRHFLPSALMGTIHETGHALYDMGYRPELDRSPIEGGASLGVHESQSRMWENIVGRSRGFWSHYFPRLRETFPTQLADQTAESFYRAINKVKPSFIRVEADEVTYNLHIMLRFELEIALISGKLKVADVPEAWNAKMQEYLGITPPNDAQGCLQDIHWSSASFGYFSTYALGTFFSAQLWDQAVRDMPTLPEQIARGQFAELLAWLRVKVHQHGRKFTLDKLARDITGEPLQTRSWIRYAKTKFGEMYGV